MPKHNTVIDRHVTVSHIVLQFFGHKRVKLKIVPDNASRGKVRESNDFILKETWMPVSNFKAMDLIDKTTNVNLMVALQEKSSSSG